MKNPFGIFKLPSPLVTPDQILAALGNVLEPEANQDLVSLGMVHNVAARDGAVSFTIRLREAGTPLQVPIERRAQRAVQAIPGVRNIHHLHIWRLNDSDIHFEAHIEVDDVPVSRTDGIRTQIQEYLHEKHDITHTTLQFECDSCRKKELV